MTRIDAISFDVFGTLIDIDEDKAAPGAFLHLSRWLGYQGIHADPLALRRELDDRTAVALTFGDRTFPDVDIAELLRDSLLCIAPDSPAIIETLLPQAAWLLRTLTTRAVSPVPGALEAVRALHGSYQLGICSNTQRACTIGELRMFGLLDRFTQIVFSSDVKACKPSPRIFSQLLSQMEIPPAAVVHVGDSYSDDVIGAQAVGMKTIWLQRKPGPVAGVPTATIATMWELPEAIRALRQA